MMLGITIFTSILKELPYFRATNLGSTENERIVTWRRRMSICSPYRPLIRIDRSGVMECGLDPISDNYGIASVLFLAEECIIDICCCYISTRCIVALEEYIQQLG
jgi:hypothetical protein